MVNEPGVRIRPVNEGDRPMLAWLVAELWGSELVAVHGTVLRPAELPGFIAERSRRVVGLLTYQLVDDMLEIVTLNAIERRIGIGTLLIEAAAGRSTVPCTATSSDPHSSATSQPSMGRSPSLTGLILTSGSSTTPLWGHDHVRARGCERSCGRGGYNADLMGSSGR